MSKKQKKKSNKKTNTNSSSIRKNVLKSVPTEFKGKKKKSINIDIIKLISDFFSRISTKISWLHYLIFTLVLIVVLFLFPYIFGIPLDTINSNFELKMSGTYYIIKFLMIDVLGLLLIFVLHSTFLKYVNLWCSDPENAKYNNLKASERTQKTIIYIPLVMFFLESILPSIIGVIICFKNIKSYPLFVLKFILFVFAFSIIFATLSFIISDKTYRGMLYKLYREDLKYKTRIPLRKKIFMYVLPISFAAFLLVSIFGYSFSIKSNLNIWHTVYNNKLDEIFPERNNYTVQRIKNIILRSNMPQKDNVSIFILNESDLNVTTVSGNMPSSFMVDYIIDLYDKNTRISYEGYGMDSQASIKKLETEKGIYYVGIIYTSEENNMLIFLLITSIIATAFVYLGIYIYMRKLSYELSNIAKEIGSVATSTIQNNMKSIPIISNDEISDIKNACNKFQTLKKGNLQMIESNQDLLHFASLGQTTSRMISGLYQPMQDILKENRFLSNVAVSISDAKRKEEINAHSEKIKSNATYVSDILSAIKGHTSIVSENTIYPFNITDLFKQVALLTKQQFLSTGTLLSVANPVNPRVLLYGNMDILVQIISNMVSNAMSCYEQMENPHKEIKLSAMLDNDTNSVIISIKDFGPGLPKEIQNKLFKEMIPTQKKGSGLGLYIAYANITSHFQGTINYETSDNGTTFIITIPIYQK